MRQTPLPPVKLKARVNFQFSGSYPQQPTHKASTHKAFCAAAAVVIVIEPIVSRRLGSSYRSGRSHCVKVKNPKAPAVKREAEEDWGNKQWSRAAACFLLISPPGVAPVGREVVFNAHLVLEQRPAFFISQ